MSISGTLLKKKKIMNRILKKDIDKFLRFLQERGYHYQYGKEDQRYFIRIFIPGKGYIPIYKNKAYPDHYTCPESLTFLVERYNVIHNKVS